MSMLAVFTVFSLSILSLANVLQASHARHDSSQNEVKSLPEGTLLVKGAWASASDSVTPLPEKGTVTRNAYHNPYFRLTYPLMSGWTEEYSGPPPSDTGYYVLAQIQPSDPPKETGRPSILIAAQDMFFGPGASSVLEMTRLANNNLAADYTVETSPQEVMVAGHSFIRSGYVSPVAGLHWEILATQIRCHMVQIVFTGRDPKLIARLEQMLNAMTLPAEAGVSGGRGGGEFPLCVNGYARNENIVRRVDPVFPDRRFNPIPVRIIIDKTGRVKHIHFLSAFPDQANAIKDALREWQFKPYLSNGRPTEAETGVLFGHSSQPNRHAEPDPTTE